MNETEHRITSAHLANERTLWILAPEATPTHLAIFLDGEYYRERVEAPAVIEELRGRREIGETLFVFVSMESVDARWKECPCYAPFARFVDEELLPWLELKYPSVRAVKERVMAGLSYTGLAASSVALTTRGRFTKVVAQSGSFWWNDSWITKRVEESGVPLATEFYLSVGDRENQTNIQHKQDVFQAISQIDGVKNFRDALVKRGANVKYVETDGLHEFSAWRKALPDALRWALPPTH
ncbi:MAG: alpha/beta hydrolase-fold protein [Nibricoccus sp.]